MPSEVSISYSPNKYFKLLVDGEWVKITKSDKGWRFLQRAVPTLNSIHGMKKDEVKK